MRLSFHETIQQHTEDWRNDAENSALITEINTLYNVYIHAFFSGFIS